MEDESNRDPGAVCCRIICTLEVWLAKDGADTIGACLVVVALRRRDRMS